MSRIKMTTTILAEEVVRKNDLLIMVMKKLKIKKNTRMRKMKSSL